MSRILPPGVSAEQYDAAIKEFATVVGNDWVLDTDEDRVSYLDLYAPGSEHQWPASAAIAPGSVEEIQQVVKIANKYKTPLWTVARGKNLGYGTAAPRLAGSLILDLGRMNKILQIDDELGYVVVEPGVSFFDLYEELKRRGSRLMMSVPGNGWGSVMGNALDHGVGYTPYGVHARNICGMTVVMPNGELMRTGMGAMDANHAAHLFPFSYGPTWDQMFTQSNLGIVTSMGMWMMPTPESSLELKWDIPEEDDIAWVIDTLAPLKISGVVDQSIFVPSWLGKLSVKGTRAQFWDKKGAMPDWRVQELLKEHKLGYWQVALRLYGEEGIVKARADVVKNAFRKAAPNLKAEETWWHEGDPINTMDPSAGTLGIPTAMPLMMGEWVGGRSAHLGFSPVVPASSKHVMGQLKRSRELIAKYDMDFYASFTIGGRFCNNINMLMWDRDDEAGTRNVINLFNDLIRVTREAGYGEYRTHLGWMDAIADTYDFNGGSANYFNQVVKDALDPNGILSPGKQGVWPTVYKEFAKNGRLD